MFTGFYGRLLSYIDTEVFTHEQGQLDTFGKLLDLTTKAKWAVREKVSKLKDISNLIPPFIKVHYQDIATGGQGYNGLSIDEQGANTGYWEWQMHVQKPGQNVR